MWPTKMERNDSLVVSAPFKCVIWLIWFDEPDRGFILASIALWYWYGNDESAARIEWDRKKEQREREMGGGSEVDAFEI